MAFYVGQKVVCVDDARRLNEPPPYLTIGSVYTVSNVYEPRPGDVNLELVELPSPETKAYYAGFISEFFRPVVERKTDISVFEKLLNPSHEEVSA